MAPQPRILAVDDTDDTLELIRLALQDDYHVMTLNNASETYELIELFEPDMLILDVMMPRISGFQLAEMLHKNPATREMPIIILSAKTSPGEIRHGYKLGASLYLTKPFDPARLKKNVDAQFEIHPPSGKPKTNTLKQCAMQLQMKYGLNKGHAQVAAGSLDKEEVLDETRMEGLRERFRHRGMARQPSEKKGGGTA